MQNLSIILIFMTKSIEALSHRLSAMVRDGQIMKDGFKFQLVADQPTYEATVYINSKGLGTAHIDGQSDLYFLNVNYV